MDIKWKKSKKIISVLSFVCGVSCAIVCVVMNPFRFIASKGDWEALVSPAATYMDHTDFQEEINWIFLNLIRAGAGEEPMEKWEFDSAYYSQQYAENAVRSLSAGIFGQTETVTVEAVAEPLDEAAVEEMTEAVPDEATEEIAEANQDNAAEKIAEDAKDAAVDSAKAIEAFLKEYEGDGNLLYEVYKDSTLMYRSSSLASKYASAPEAEDTLLQRREELSAEGYTMELHFDGKQSGIIRYGEEISLYERKTFTGNDQWLVPGYENYPVPEHYEQVEVYLWISENPQLHYTPLGYTGYELLHMKERFEYRREYLKNWGIAAGIGMLCLVMTLGLRRYHREAVRQIGKTLSRIWLEARLVGLGLWIFLFQIFWMDIFMDDRVAVGYVVASLWILWLIILDLRACPKFWKCSLLGKFARYMRAKHMKLSIQKRLQRQAALPLVLGGSALVVGCMALFMEENFGGDYIGLLWTLAVISGVGFLIALIWNFWTMRNLALDLGTLDKQLERIEQGTVPDICEMPIDDELADMSERLSRIHHGLESAVQERMKSERMKVELVTNVSHDIKTPLTSIISYVDLLKKEENLPEDVKDYIEILSQKSERLRAMVQDVFEVSKAASGQLPVKMEKLDLAKLLRQTLADMQEKIEEAPVVLRVEIPEAAVWIRADGQRMYRVFQNLLQNALAYSLEGSRVYLRLRVEKEPAGEQMIAIADIRNTSRQELDGVTDFTERFVRGDESRTDGGSGLGLSIARSFTEACGGKFEVEAIADLFLAAVRFPVQ